MIFSVQDTLLMKFCDLKLQQYDSVTTALTYVDETIVDNVDNDLVQQFYTFAGCTLSLTQVVCNCD